MIMIMSSHESVSQCQGSRLTEVTESDQSVIGLIAFFRIGFWDFGIMGCGGESSADTSSKATRGVSLSPININTVSSGEDSQA